MKNNIQLGVIADDFTGASDAASFLIKNGLKVIMVSDVHHLVKEECDVLIVALKIRSIAKEEALKQISDVLVLFEKLGISKVYYKFCSTFDSTPDGNIGPVMDYLLEYFNERYTILTPSLPINGRTVKDGYLYVNQIPLAESSMKNHPLNPMWDSYIPNLMKPQSKYFTYPLDIKDMNSIKKINDNHFYLVPNYYNDEDGKKIGEIFSELKVLGGGSGLLEHLLIKGKHTIQDTEVFSEKQKAIIVCGSCSQMTKRQIEYYIMKGYRSICIDSLSLLENKLSIEDIFNQVLGNLPDPTLIYSDGINKDMTIFSNDEKFITLSGQIEQLNAGLCLKARNLGFNKIIVAGGETSGAVSLMLGYNAYLIGNVVAPGVPVLIPIDNKKLKLILKSGNFGTEDFFVKALEE